MKTFHHLILALVIALAGGLLISTASAADQNDQPHIVALVGTGTATIVVDGQSRPAAKGDAVPLNAQIQTDGNVEAYVMVATGVVATVKPSSTVSVETLSATDTQLHLERGRLVTEIDKNRPNPRMYKVRIGQGIAAARGTSFTVSDDNTGFSITTTADGVTFSPASGGQLTIRAGQVYYTPPGAPLATEPMPLATAAASNPAIASILRDAVNTAATVVQNNLGNISPDSATNILAQVVAVSAAALPQEAVNFAQTAVAAATAPGSATATSSGAAGSAAATITAAAIESAPDQAAAIAGAAAAAAPANADVITAAAQQVAPVQKDAIAQQVAASTGQSTSTVQSNADAAGTQATNSVNSAKDATSNVVAPPSGTGSAGAGANGANTPKTTEQQRSPTTPVDPTLNTSPAT